MGKLHILQGDKTADRDSLIKAAKRNLTTPRWIAPKSARPGDQAVIYVDGMFFATASITTDAARRPDWGPRRYGAGLASIKLVKPPIGLDTIRKRVPDLS